MESFNLELIQKVIKKVVINGEDSVKESKLRQKRELDTKRKLT
jgi:hypothetical protein